MFTLIKFQNKTRTFAANSYQCRLLQNTPSTLHTYILHIYILSIELRMLKINKDNKESPLTIEKYVLISFWFKGGRRPGLLWRYNLFICSSVWRNKSLKQLMWWSICIFERMKLFYSDAEVPRNKLCNAIILWCLTNAVSLKSDVDIKINCPE